MPVSEPSYVDGRAIRRDPHYTSLFSVTETRLVALVAAEAEVERLRASNVALRQALVRIEDHARRVGDDALAGVALIARDAINAS